MTKKCLNCKKGDMVYDKMFGWLPCIACREKQQRYFKPNSQIEFTSSEVKEARKKHRDDIIQPFRKGELSKEYLNKYGTKGIKVSKEEVKKAKNVWNEDYYKDI